MYIYKIKEETEQLEAYVRERESDLMHCQDKLVLDIWEVELNYVKARIRLNKRTMKKKEQLNADGHI